LTTQPASRIDRTPHWLIKQAIFNYLEKLENDETLPELPALLSGAANESDDASVLTEEPYQPFLEFAEQILPQSVSRAAITAAWRRPETDAVPMLLEQARLPQPLGEQAHKLAYQLAEKLRNQKTASGRAGMVQSLLQEFSLSSQEGVALMCLAEALLRIPDKATRDALIRERQLAVAHWPQPVAVRQRRHLGAAVHRQTGLHPQRNQPLPLAEPHHRQERRTADPQGRGYGDATDGRTVRHRGNHRRSAGQRPQAGR
jgi:hypothetical protein